MTGIPPRRYSQPPVLPRGDALNGVLLVDKPAGPTSHDVVDRIRRRFRFRKVGHGGSLDPQATGLLVILLGKGTKIAGHFMTGDKTYEGVMRLGVATDTHDADGRTTEERDSGHVTRERLAEEMAKYQGDIMQTPPMVSAIKKDGVALYKLARRGEVVERKPRLVHVYEFALGDFSPPRASFRLRCTKGTYVRTLCHDVGQGLGCGAHLEQLRRTMCAGFDLQEANPLDRILEMDVSRLAEHVIPLAAIRTGGPEPSAGNA